MNTLYSILIVLEAIVCFLLIGIVLLQKSTGDGNGLSFGSGAESVFGAQTGNVLTRGTVILAVVFLVNTLALCILRPEARGTSLSEQIVQEQQKAAATVDTEAADLLNTEEALPEALPVEDIPDATPEAPAAEAPAAEAPAAEAPAAEAPAAEAPAAEAPAAEAPAAEAPAAEAPAAEAPAAEAPAVETPAAE